MCGQHNVNVSAGDNTGQNTDKEYTPNPGAKRQGKQRKHCLPYLLYVHLSHLIYV